ncbi:SWPV1-231 [Shearwaterpox virus]|uniref:SWPV1-231 n=1 Tax=Shearwaterpox virus TaxID=1974596 RepID=A0A1V0QGZ1_CNPV|nr:SWPV1-231 [Shearwaterpox virus]
MADSVAGAKKRKRRSRKATIRKEETAIPEDACTTCSICQSKLVMFSEINKYNLSEHLNKGKLFSSSNLKCNACGSSLCHLSDLSKS